MTQVRCIKCEGANKNFFILTTGEGGGEENTKNSYIHDHFGGEKLQKHDGEKQSSIFSPQKTTVKMTGCLARFRSKGNLLICEIRNKDHVRVYHGISFIQKVKRPYRKHVFIYMYIYQYITSIYLSICLYVCMYVHMYVCIYLSVCLYMYIYLFLLSLHQKSPENKV